MKQGSLFIVVAVLLCLAFTSDALAAAPSDAANITAVELEVAVDTSGRCSLNMNGTIKTDGKVKVWYGFEGPGGVTFDFGAEDTSEVTYGNQMGLGKGAKFTTDIRGQFVLKAAVVGADGKKGAIVASKPVAANYTCGNGAKVARAVAPGTPMPKSSLPVPEIASVKLTSTVDKSSKCTVGLRGEIETGGTKKLWYKFEAPVGSTFDYAAESTEDIELNSGMMMDKSISFTKDIHGVFLLRAATVDENGKLGPVVTSKPLPGNYTCGGGTQIARPIAPAVGPKVGAKAK